MARTVTEIVTEIDTQIAAEATLSGASVSKVAKWRVFRYIIALAIYTLEKRWDIKEQELISIANKRYGTNKWWEATLLAFQYNYPLNDKLSYSTVDEAAQIVKRSSAVTVVNGNSVTSLLKVATDNGSGLEPLSGVQVTALQSYIIDVKPFGIGHTLVNQPPDLLKLKMQVFYDGKLDLAGLKTLVEAAITDYSKSLFDDKINVNDLGDAVDAIDGVEDYNLIDLQVKPDGGAYLTVTHEIQPISGYFKVDPAFPLDATAQIEYIAR